MLGLLNEKSKRQVKPQEIETKQDDRIEVITLSDFIDERRNLF